MKIYVITSDKFGGSVWHRVVTPHAVMAKRYEDVSIMYASGISALTDKQIQEYDYLVCHQTYWDDITLDRVRSLGVKIIYDFDDYWVLEPFMRSYDKWKHFDMKGIILNAASRADVITCTTPILADSIRKELPNRVEVIENGVNTDEEQWRPSPTPDWDGVRFGYIGAIDHFHDVHQMFGAQTAFDIYVLNTFKMTGLPYGFKSFEGRGFREYARIYETVDVCLAPLIVSRFNRHKSELKMIEAGFKKKPIIVSNVEPFTLLINDKNCISINKPRPWEWIKAMQRMKESKALREDIAEALYQDVSVKYDLLNLAEKRRQIYESL